MVSLIDQARLLLEGVWLNLDDFRYLGLAIKEMRIRGAPAIGTAGAYTIGLSGLKFDRSTPRDFMAKLEVTAAEVQEARPKRSTTAFDATPKRYVTATIADRAVVRRPYEVGLACVMRMGIG